jgi:hypothetical protein
VAGQRVAGVNGLTALGIADSSEVPDLVPLHWGPVPDRVLCGRIDFFRGQEHDCPYGRTARLANGKCERGGALVVRKLGDGESVMVAQAW